MRVAMALHTFNRQGGSERAAVELAEGLAQRGQHVTLYGSRFANLTPGLAHPRRVVAIARPWFARTASFPLMASMMLPQRQYDVVHNHGGCALLRQDVITAHSCHAGWVQHKLASGSYTGLLTNPDHAI